MASQEALIPGKRYKFRAEDCCLNVELTAVFIRQEEAIHPSPRTIWDIGTIEGKLYDIEEVPAPGSQSGS